MSERANKYAGKCSICGFKVDAGAGLLKGRRGAWTTEHVGGCPEDGEPWEERERKTTRERREAKAERLRGWADGREAKAAERYETASQAASVIPFGQPILVGHHSEGRDRNYRARIESNYRKSFEHAEKAEEMRSRADGIEHGLRTSIYSDDVDAIEQLEARIVGLEAERDRIKAYNASCRKDARDVSMLTEAERENLVNIAKHCAYSLGKKGEFPRYHLSNLTGNIGRQRKRLERLKREREQ